MRMLHHGGRKNLLAWGVLFVFVGIISFPAARSHSAEIDEINDAIHVKGAKWVAKENPISVLPREERRRRLGALEELDTGTVADESLSGAVTLPSAFDWRNYNGNNFVTPVRDQGSCGSCWAFSTTAALESKTLITYGWSNTDLNLSEQIVVSCTDSLAPSGDQRPNNCESGGYASTASDFLKYTGTNLESCYSYKATDGACSSACSSWQGNVYRFTGWSSVVSGGTATASALKNAIYTDGPVVAWFQVYADFYSYHSGIYSYTSGIYEGNHFVLVVGWDDSQSAFIVKNSWGAASWGESGYFRISYSELSGTTQFGRWTYAYPGNVIAPTVYVAQNAQNGQCGSKTPCFATLQSAINSAKTHTMINITQETYNENVVLNGAKVLSGDGGWDSTFTNCLWWTTIHGSLTISDGTLLVEGISLK